MGYDNSRRGQNGQKSQNNNRGNTRGNNNNNNNSRRGGDKNDSRNNKSNNSNDRNGSSANKRGPNGKTGQRNRTFDPTSSNHASICRAILRCFLNDDANPTSGSDRERISRVVPHAYNGCRSSVLSSRAELGCEPTDCTPMEFVLVDCNPNEGDVKLGGKSSKEPGEHEMPGTPAERRAEAEKIRAAIHADPGCKEAPGWAETLDRLEQSLMLHPERAISILVEKGARYMSENPPPEGTIAIVDKNGRYKFLVAKSTTREAALGTISFIKNAQKPDIEDLISPVHAFGQVISYEDRRGNNHSITGDSMGLLEAAKGVPLGHAKAIRCMSAAIVPNRKDGMPAIPQKLLTEKGFSGAALWALAAYCGLIEPKKVEVNKVCQTVGITFEENE